MNNWNFTGNLGNDAETRFAPSGDAIVSFSVGVKAGYGEKATTTWARCSMFGKRGQAVSEYLTKGQLVGISGEMSAREWNDKEGNKRTSIEVRVNDLTLLGKPSHSQPAAQPAQKAAQADTGFDDTVPF
jgi:single-strand DNA-binding protein